MTSSVLPKLGPKEASVTARIVESNPSLPPLKPAAAKVLADFAISKVLTPVAIDKSKKLFLREAPLFLSSSNLPPKLSRDPVPESKIC